jgi:uracil phosphoribosyltransferase
VALLSRIRAKDTKPAEFRRLLDLVGGQLIVAATSDLNLLEVPIETPMGTTLGVQLVDRIVFVPVLRAGLGFVNAALALYPDAEVRHLGMYRDEQTLSPVHYYNKIGGQLSADVAIILDPMLATGGSAIATVEVLKQAGVPVIKLVCLIVAPEGIEALQRAHPDVMVYTAAVDEKLNEIGYIIPGLGDAGDRQFGTG